MSRPSPGSVSGCGRRATRSPLPPTRRSPGWSAGARWSTGRCRAIPGNWCVPRAMRSGPGGLHTADGYHLRELGSAGLGERQEHVGDLGQAGGSHPVPGPLGGPAGGGLHRVVRGRPRSAPRQRRSSRAPVSRSAAALRAARRSRTRTATNAPWRGPGGWPTMTVTSAADHDPATLTGPISRDCLASGRMSRVLTSAGLAMVACDEDLRRDRQVSLCSGCP